MVAGACSIFCARVEAVTTTSSTVVAVWANAHGAASKLAEAVSRAIWAVRFMGGCSIPDATSVSA
ncbi:hypothetical protein D3C81_1758720 [compost metagenome]